MPKRLIRCIPAFSRKSVTSSVNAAALALVLTGALGAGCATAGKPKQQPKKHAAAPTKTATQQLPSDSTAVPGLKEIQSLYERGLHDEARARYQQLEAANPVEARSVSGLNLIGLIKLALKNPADAASDFRSAIQKNKAPGGNPKLTEYIEFNLASAELESGDAKGALATLDHIQAGAVEPGTRVKVHYLRARALQAVGQPVDAARETLLAVRTAGPDASTTTFTPALEQSLAAINDPAELENIYRDFEDSPLADYVLFRLGSAEIAAGNQSLGGSRMRELISRFPKSPWASRAAELAKTKRMDIATDSKKIGVLLPMKGKFAGYASRSLQGVELGFHLFGAAGAVPESDSGYTLVMEDSGEDVAQALQALDKLVLKHHVVAVIGPLLSKGIEQVTSRAEELGVPLISLARNEGIHGDYIFQSGLTLRLQAQAIADYAVKNLGMKRFAVLYPRDKVGEEASRYFWDEVESLGAEVRGVESYQGSDRDFRQVVDKLLGLYYTEARQSELDQLTKLREENGIKKCTRKTEKYCKLAPLVDFDAVFLPEEPKLAGQILPTFAYRDADKVKFLGTSVWNSPELPQWAGAEANKTLFVDAFFPQAPNAATRKFMEKYRATFGDDPIGMDALAYDAARILDQALTRAGSSASRSQVRDELARTENFPGVTGNISYKNGQFTRDLKVLTVKGGQITLVGGSEKQPKQ